MVPPIDDSTGKVTDGAAVTRRKLPATEVNAGNVVVVSPLNQHENCHWGAAPVVVFSAGRSTWPPRFMIRSTTVVRLSAVTFTFPLSVNSCVEIKAFAVT